MVEMVRYCASSLLHLNSSYIAGSKETLGSERFLGAHTRSPCNLSFQKDLINA